MDVRHREALDRDADPLCRGGLAQRACNPCRRRPQRLVGVGIEVEEVIGVSPGNEHEVTGIDVLQREERDVIDILVNRPARQASREDLAEDAGVRVAQGGVAMNGVNASLAAPRKVRYREE